MHAVPPGGSKKHTVGKRHYVSHGVEVDIEESAKGISLTLNGQPIDVSLLAGQYHSQIANQFMGFSSVEELVEEMLRNEGRYWSLQGGPTHPHHDHGGGP